MFLVTSHASIFQNHEWMVWRILKPVTEGAPAFRNLPCFEGDRVLDEGLPGFDALGGLEDDSDIRALRQDALDGDPDGHHRGEDRDDPDDGKTPALGRVDG